jgi:hypothetical protein
MSWASRRTDGQCRDANMTEPFRENVGNAFYTRDSTVRLPGFDGTSNLRVCGPDRYVV